LTQQPSRVDGIGAEVDRLVDGEAPRIGLVWASGLTNTSHAASYAPLDHWRLMLNHPTATFFTLQYGDIQEDLDSLCDDQPPDLLDRFGRSAG